jgi:hypothetical protein
LFLGAALPRLLRLPTWMVVQQIVRYILSYVGPNFFDPKSPTMEKSESFRRIRGILVMVLRG